MFTKIVTYPYQWFKSLRKRNKVVTIVLVIIIGIVVTRTVITKKGNGYMTELPKRETITETVTETGNVITSNTIPIFSETEGVVEEVYVQNDLVVKEGQELFTIHSTATEQEKATAKSDYLAIQAALNTAKAAEYSAQASMFEKWDQYKNLAEGDAYEDSDGKPKTDKRTLPEFVISQKEWLAAETTYKTQQEIIAQKQADLVAKRITYLATQDSTVKAQTSGTIQNLSVVKGQTVSVNLPSQPQKPILLLRQDTRTIIEVKMSELDIEKVYSLQSAKFTVDGKVDNKGEYEYDGVVDRVDAVGTNNQGVVTYSVYIVNNEPLIDFRPGMTATVTIEVAKKENVLTVSSSAVKPHEGGRAVQVVDPKTNKPIFIPVEIGLRGDGRTEIISGIDETTEVITALTNDQVKRTNAGPFGQ